MRQSVHFAIVLLAVVTAACSEFSEVVRGQPRLVLEVKLSMAADGQATAQLGVRNAGTGDFTGSDSFNGVMEVRQATGQPRLRSDMRMVGPIRAGEAVFPLGWTGMLDPADYTLTWQAPGAEGVSVDFSIEQRGTGPFLLAPPEYIDPMTEFTVSAP